jgi:pimeloyl-ACP methyl ester carboxylesterase
MANFVLVPGFWLGGWAWQRVAKPLRAAGHEVYPVTLTGLGERVHLASPQVDLDTHICDVVNVIEYEDLHEVVLVGHSGGGSVVTGVSDRIPERLSQLVYLDSGPLSDGMAWIETNPPERREYVERRTAEQGEGWRYPLPPWEEIGAGLDGLGKQDLLRFRSRATDQPARALTQTIRLSNPARHDLPKTLISCSFPLEQVKEMIANGHPFFTELNSPQWNFYELPTGHWPMFSRPADTAALLDEVARSQA